MDVLCKCGKKTPKSEPEKILSPVNLRDDAQPAPEDTKEPFRIDRLDKMISTEIMNEADQIRIRFCPSQSPVILGGGLSHKEYIIDRIEFHWGSAHLINSERFPLETNILMYCTEYSGIDEALKKEGAAALSIFHQLSDTTSRGISKLLTFIPQIGRYVGKPIPYCVVTLQDFLPNDIQSYWRYTGSTMEDPVQGGVEWTIFKEQLPITMIDLGAFTNISDKTGKLIVSNFKNVQCVPPNAQIYRVTHSC